MISKLGHEQKKELRNDLKRFYKNLKKIEKIHSERVDAGGYAWQYFEGGASTHHFPHGLETDYMIVSYLIRDRRSIAYPCKDIIQDIEVILNY